MLIDTVKIHLKSGKGGNGCSSMRREKFIPFGGPDGGNGGNGGDVIIRSNSGLNSLMKWKRRPHVFGENGENGLGKGMHGKDGNDFIIDVPIGTEVLDAKTEVKIFDFTEHNISYIIAKGGRGGKGNIFFKTKTDNAPRKFTYGEEGDAFEVILKLKLMCDFGIVGKPNAGKSSFINCISRANSEIGDFPFTTLTPILGAVEYEFDAFVVVDIPGLIEGSHENKGLGVRFLQHIERCKSLIFMIDISTDSYIEDYFATLHEIVEYNSDLLNRSRIYVLNKIDLVDPDELQERKCAFIKKVECEEKDLFLISAQKRLAIDELKKKLWIEFKKAEIPKDW